MPEIFNESWAEALGRELQESEEYQKAAQKWEGPLVLELAASDGIEEDRALFLDLWHGECREARLAEPEDREACDFVIRADLATWKTVLDGTISPLPAIMRGKLKLAKGRLASLMPYTAAARELVAAAARIETTFPEDAPETGDFP